MQPQQDQVTSSELARSPANRSPFHLWHAAILGLTALAYAIVLVPAYAAIGIMAASLSVIPIAVAGWLYGRLGGLLAGLVSIPVHVALFTIAGGAGWQIVLGAWPGSLMGLVCGVVVGWLGEFLAHVQAQARDLARQRAALQAEIAERRRVEEALVQAKASAETASRAKSQFLANMSHELRTPLTAIIGYCDLICLLAQQPHYDTLSVDLEHIRNSGQHLLKLIGNLLDLSKIEAEKMPLDHEVFSVATFAAEVEASVLPIIARNENSFELDLPADLGLMSSDRTKLRQILFNLLGNAAKFTTRGAVKLAITREFGPAPEADWLRFVVSDTGVGIVPEALEHLFEPFTQADADIARVYGGTGLGLALSQRFCELLGGTIAVASTVGHGSSFTVRLPATLAPPADAPAPHAAPMLPATDCEAP